MKNLTEELLNDLCQKVFLPAWCYPNLFKDNKNGQEVCDLLAIFENHLFLFSVKEGSFDLSKDLQTQWNRWLRKPIARQIEQLSGAERYIKRRAPIFCDEKRKIPFPFSLNYSDLRIHKIIIAHGAEEACKQFSDENIYGSLGIFYDTISDAASDEMPFIVKLDKADPVHVFDSSNYVLLLKQLDTIIDFKNYLTEKERAIQRYDSLMYCGEEDLLAHYLYNVENRNHMIGVKDETINVLFIPEGDWSDFEKSDVYKKTQIANQISYEIWDRLIHETCLNIQKGTTRGNSDVFREQHAIHEMAKEPRFMRRELSIGIKEAIDSFPEQHGSFRHVKFMESFHKDTGYVFLQLKIEGMPTFDGPNRWKRQKLLEIACEAAKCQYRHLKKVVGIAMDAIKFSPSNSEDFCLLDCEDWTDEQFDEAEKCNQEFGFFRTGAQGKKRISEFVY